MAGTLGLGSNPTELIAVSEAARMINVALDAGGMEELMFKLSDAPTATELQTLFRQLESILNHRKVIQEEEEMQHGGGMPPVQLSLRQRLAGNKSYQLSLQTFRRTQHGFAAMRGGSEDQQAAARADEILRGMGR